MPASTSKAGATTYRKSMGYRTRRGEGRRCILLGVHRGFDLLRRVWQLFGEIHELSLSINIEGIFDADAYFFLGNVDTRLDGEHGTNLEGLVVVVRIVYIDANGVPEGVDEVLTQRLALQVLAVRVDVIEGDLVERCFVGICPTMING